MRASRTIEQIRLFFASVDGSALDVHTWRARHRRIVQLALALTLFDAIFSIADPQAPREQWIYVGIAVVVVAAAGLRLRSRRALELLAAAGLALAQLYVARFVGNFTLGPLVILVLAFYQDWVPIAAVCALVGVMVLVAGVDPSYYNGTRAFAKEVPLIGMSLRAAAVWVAAFLALAVWRAGSQLGRDQLTGTFSRAGAERALDREIARGRRPVAWVCDIDNFRTVNQRLGPEVGDRLLKHVGARLRRLCRAEQGSWFCARLVGDTFVVVSRHLTDDQFVAAFAERLEREVGLMVAGIAEHDVPVRLSVGAAAAFKGATGLDVMRVAERNMRAAKGRGSVRVVVGSEADHDLTDLGPLLSVEMHRACEQDELELYLQPIVRLSDDVPVGAEALARWRHPDGRLVLPGEFLPEVERDSGLLAVVSTHLAVRFRAMVGELVERHGMDWLSYGYTFNVSAIRLRDPGLPRSVAQLQQAGGGPDLSSVISLEVTEGALMDFELQGSKVLAELSEMGYRIVLDDFGTGHSSLAHLRDFPLNCVKIDRSFVQSMHASPTNRAVVQAVADIASASGLRVIAEGVETPAQRDMLLAIKPDILAQGWLYAKALPLPEFEAWVGARIGVHAHSAEF